MTAKNPAERYADPAEVAAALAPFAEGHHLARLVRGAVGGTSPRSRTHGIDEDGNARREERRIGYADADDAAVGACRGRCRQCRGRRLSRAGDGRADARRRSRPLAGWRGRPRGGANRPKRRCEARQHTLQVAAKFAASEILKEIDLRFDILSRLAADDELRQQMMEINNRPERHRAVEAARRLARRAESRQRRESGSDSWFINDARGVQVARSPRSEASRGENYAHRDYFHGQGIDLPPDTKDLKPIDAPHLSAVYRSTSTGPLEGGVFGADRERQQGQSREVVGVLAMSVDLGEFNVLEKELPPGHEVVLIDLRDATIDGQTRRGLILHHQQETSYREGQPPPWIGGEILARIDKLLSNADADGLGQRRDAGRLSRRCADERPARIGARAAGDRSPSGGAARDIRWLVLVQEPLRNALRAAISVDRRVCGSRRRSMNHCTMPASTCCMSVASTINENGERLLLSTVPARMSARPVCFMLRPNMSAVRVSGRRPNSQAISPANEDADGCQAGGEQRPSRASSG